MGGLDDGVFPPRGRGKFFDLVKSIIKWMGRPTLFYVT